MTPDFSSHRQAWILVGILGLAAAIRAWTLAFGLPSLNDQDELMFELGALRMLREHSLNPGWFGHPASTTMYGLAIVDVLVYLAGLITGRFADVRDFADAVFADPGVVILPGRAMILCFGLLVIALVYRLGARLFGTPAGLVAAMLLAVSPLHVTYSQIIRSDMMACAFMLLGLLASLRVAREGRRRDFAMAGVWAGVATASKWPFALGILGAVGAVGLRLFAPSVARPRELVRLAGSGAAMLMALVAVSPYLVLAYPTVARNLQGEAQTHHLGATGGSFAWNGWWYLTHPLLDGLGPAGLLLAAMGSVMIARHREARAILGPVILVFALLLCVQNLIWARWCLPLLALLAIGAGAAFVRIAALAARLGGRAAGMAATGAIALMVVVPLGATVAADGRERMNDTRQQASRWLVSHVPAGKVVLVEHFGFDLVSAPYKFLWPVGDAGCLDPVALLKGKVSYAMVETWRNGRANIDFGTVALGRLESCRADYAILTQYDRYRAERAYFPRELSNYQELIDSGRTVAIFRPRRGVSGGWVVRVVQLGTRHRILAQTDDRVIRQASCEKVGTGFSQKTM